MFRFQKREHPEFDRVKFLNPMMWLRIATHRDLATSLRFTAKKSARLIHHNSEYPTSPSGFDKWHKELLIELNEADERFLS